MLYNINIINTINKKYQEIQEMETLIIQNRDTKKRNQLKDKIRVILISDRSEIRRNQIGRVRQGRYMLR